MENLKKIVYAMNNIITALSEDLNNENVDYEEMVLKGIKKALEEDVSNKDKIIIILDILEAYTNAIDKARLNNDTN